VTIEAVCVLHFCPALVKRLIFGLDHQSGYAKNAEREMDEATGTGDINKTAFAARCFAILIAIMNAAASAFQWPHIRKHRHSACLHSPPILGIMVIGTRALAWFLFGLGKR